MSSAASSNLSVHLESADSVRTNPALEQSEIHSNRFFAEAFCRLLMGEQICSGQVPLFDSYGAVLFYADLLAAIDRLRNEEDVFLTNRPLIMSHYPGTSAAHVWEGDGVEKRIFAETLASRLGNPGFLPSSIPEFQESDSMGDSQKRENQERRAIIGDALSSCAGTGLHSDSFLSYIENSGLGEKSRDHLRRLAVIDTYFRTTKNTTRLNAKVDTIPLANFLHAALKDEAATKEFEAVSGFFDRLLTLAGESISRSVVYLGQKAKGTDPEIIGIEQEFESGSANFLLAKEMVDSFYMWEQARLAGAGVEITSSQIESSDELLNDLGEKANDWADRTKVDLVSQGGQRGIPSRPVLQMGKLSGTGSLTNESYRKKLAEGMASLLLGSELFEHRKNLLDLKGDESEVIDFWHSMIEMVNSCESLNGLVSMNVTEHGVIISHFEGIEYRHQVASKAEGLGTDSETVGMIREELTECKGAEERIGAEQEV